VSADRHQETGSLGMLERRALVASRDNVHGCKPGIIEDLHFFRTIAKT
jgi:hypothetical protein